MSTVVFCTGDYRATRLAVGDKGHYEIGGSNDATSRLIELLEQLHDAG